MKERKIHIDKLEIRLPKGSKLSARQIAEGLGNEILNQIANVPNRQANFGPIEKLDIGKINSPGNRTISSLQRQIAGKVVSEIGKKTNQRSGK